MEDVTRCPRCHSDEVLPIAYGVPTPRMVEESIAGRMTLGGAWRGPGLPTGVVLCATTSGAMMRRGPSLERGSGASICLTDFLADLNNGPSPDG